MKTRIIKVTFVNGHVHTITDRTEFHSNVTIERDRIVHYNVNMNGEHVDEMFIPLSNVLYYTITDEDEK